MHPVTENKVNNESGITLVELLAALSLLMIVILLAGSIHMFGQRHFKSQNESASQANNVSYALADMSSDLRRYKPVEVKFNDNQITVNDEVLYQVKKGQLIKGDNILIADSIESMEITTTGVGTYGINIKLISNSEYSNPKVYETTITFRGVEINEADEE